MNQDEWNRSVELGINPAMCYYSGEELKDACCGAMATKFLDLGMAEIPPMPMCDRHFEEFADWTKDDSMAVMFGLLADKMSEEELEGEDDYGN